MSEMNDEDGKGTRSGPSLTLTLPTPFPLSLVSFLTSLATPLSRRSRSVRRPIPTVSFRLASFLPSLKRME